MNVELVNQIEFMLSDEKEEKQDESFRRETLVVCVASLNGRRLFSWEGYERISCDYYYKFPREIISMTEFI